MSLNRRFGIGSLVWLLCAPLGAQGDECNVDFVRGDANGDGELTFCDSFRVIRYLFVPPEDPDVEWISAIECHDAADANDSGSVDIADAVAIATYLMATRAWEGTDLPAPFLEPGPDPTEDDPELQPECGCRSYGGNVPVEDPSARVEVSDSGARGGDDRVAFVRISGTSSRILGGFACRLVTEGKPYSIVSGEPLLPHFMGTGAERDGEHRVFIIPESRLPRIDATESVVDFFEIGICFEPGTLAGEYEFSVDDIELFDFETGLPIHTEPATGTIRLLQDVSAEAACAVEDSPPPTPIHGRFELGNVSASPGSVARVPFYVQADAGIQGYSLSIDFDETVLSGQAVREVWQREDGADLSFTRFEFNNENETPGAAGIDEGYLTGAVVIDSKLPTTMPAGSLHHALEIRFLVDAETEAEVTPLEFEDGAILDGLPAVNMIIANQRRAYTQENAASFVLIGGLVGVLPDILVFIRGDANRDARVDLSDPVATLGYLFLGMDSVKCSDAADADDSGALDITDAIYTLSYLFLGGSPPEAPYPLAGFDTSEDSLGCGASSSDS